MNDTVYSVSGLKYNWVVKEHGPSKFSVRKVTKAGGKEVGKPQFLASEYTAKQVADRRAREEGSLV